MEIHVGSYIAASFLLQQEPNQWHALVVLDSDKIVTEFLKTHTRSHLVLRFDDIQAPQSGKQLPTKSLIQQGLDFAQGKDKLLVSCRAGQSRSVALAYLIVCREHDSAVALKLLDPTRHVPNRLVVSLGDALLETSDTLDQFDEWRRRYSHVRLSDYYEEMERELDELESRGALNKICTP